VKARLFLGQCNQAYGVEIYCVYHCNQLQPSSNICL